MEACREGGIIPFFYHTLLDWHHEDYEQNFPRYLDYLQDSVEILCRNYGKIGGFWFDGMWDKPGEDWQEGRLYECIRQFQPEAMIINNTGLSQQGKVSHSEIDSVTFERGSPQKVDCSDKIRAGEMCQILNDHWGYAKDDCNYKSVRELIENFIDCRMAGCNFLINTGLRGNGSCNPPDRELLRQFGNWVRRNGASLYGARCAGIAAENAEILTDGKDLYAILRNVPMSADPNVTKTVTERQVVIFGEKEIRQGIWLDNGKTFAVQDNRFFAEPFPYGTSFSVRVAKLILK